MEIKLTTDFDSVKTLEDLKFVFQAFFGNAQLKASLDDFNSLGENKKYFKIVKEEEPT